MESLFEGQTNKRVLYSPTLFAKQNLFHLQEVGELKSSTPHTSEREGLYSYLFLIVKSGSGSVIYEKNEYELKKGDCFFVDCLKHYAHRCNNWEIFWVHFNGNGMAGIYNKFLERSGKPVFVAKEEENLSNIITDLYSIALTEDPIRDMRINEKLSSLLMEIMQQSLKPLAQNRTHGSITRIKDYLDENYTQQISLALLSNLFKMNKYILEKEFKKKYGLAIIEYLLRVRIIKAKELLRFSDKTIEEIGRCVGINEPYYFSRVFKKIEGISPREFRRQWL